MAEDGADGATDAKELYRLVPEEFTAARDALARRLRSAGERDRAEEVRRLRRPNAPAWALNQVAQDRPELIETVLAAGSELREAMEIGDGRLLRDAERSTRQAVDGVVGEAERVLSRASHAVTDDLRARLAATLRAAIVDPEVAPQLQAGMLERDLELPGFGLETPVPPTPRPAKRSVTRAKPTEDDRKQRERQERDERAAEQEREERRRREESRRAAKRQLNELEAEAKRLGRQAERLGAAAERAEEEARSARAEADAAAAAADEAAAKAIAARRDVEALDSS